LILSNPVQRIGKIELQSLYKKFSAAGIQLNGDVKTKLTFEKWTVAAVYGQNFWICIDLLSPVPNNENQVL
jgi:hypothetical protein